MAITCMERYQSRRVTDGERAELQYLIRGTADEAAALASLKATAPATFGSLVREPVQLEPQHVVVGDDDASSWLGRVEYRPASVQSSRPETGESLFSFDTGGGTQHITQSIATISSYSADATQPDFHGAINVTHDNVEGVDITVPVYNFSETHYLAAATVTSGYKGTLFGLTGKVNNASFRGLAAGECLFLGASGSQRGNGEDWEITFRFAGSPNRTGIDVGPISGIAKKGWEYMWVRYKDAVDDTYLIQIPSHVYVEKVYDLGDFSGLGIGS